MLVPVTYSKESKIKPIFPTLTTGFNLAASCSRSALVSEKIIGILDLCGGTNAEVMLKKARTAAEVFMVDRHT